MMPYQSYQMFEAERVRTPAEQRAADVRRGEIAAAISRSFRAGRAQLRARKVAAPRVRNWPARPAQAQ